MASDARPRGLQEDICEKLQISIWVFWLFEVTKKGGGPVGCSSGRKKHELEIAYFLWLIVSPPRVTASGKSEVTVEAGTE